MLVDFRLFNFKSFKDENEFSLIADKVNEHKTYTFVEEKYNLLKSSVVYGANASGKSNFFEAIDFFINYIKNSHKNQSGKIIDINNFKLSTETENEPTGFEMTFIIDKQMYRYGFSLTKNFIDKEWLYSRPNKREIKLFERDKQKIVRGNSFKEVKKVDDMTKENTLFLSVLAQWNSDTAKKVIEWFNKIHILHSNYNVSSSFTASLLLNPERKNKILDYLKTADIGIENLNASEKDFDTSTVPDYIRKQIEDEIKEKLPETLKVLEVTSKHKKYNEKKEVVGTVNFDFEHEESEGTKKYFSLIGPIIDTLEKGNLLFIDEIDTRLHPLIIEYIVDLFNCDSNKNNAQIVFSTHNTNILRKDKLRRDQVWFVEKNRYGESNLFSLLEIKGIRNDASYNKDYLEGKYGAIPIIESMFSEGDFCGK